MPSKNSSEFVVFITPYPETKDTSLSKTSAVNDLFSASTLVTAPYLFFPAISSVTVHNIHIFFIYCTYFYLINLIFCHDFQVCFHQPPYLQEVGISKCRNTVFLPD